MAIYLAKHISQMEFSAKLLPSGKYQVRFSVGEYYGYLLAEPKSPVREIIDRIIRHLDEVNKDEMDRYYQRNLYSMDLRKPSSGRLLLFRKPKSAVKEAIRKPAFKTMFGNAAVDQFDRDSKAA